MGMELKQFAKVYETERGQIVALRYVNSDDEPAIVFMFDPGVDGLGVCQIALGFSDDDEGIDLRDKAFDVIDQDGVEAAVFEQIDKIREMFGGDE